MKLNLQPNAATYLHSKNSHFLVAYSNPSLSFTEYDFYFCLIGMSQWAFFISSFIFCTYFKSSLASIFNKSFLHKTFYKLLVSLSFKSRRHFSHSFVSTSHVALVSFVQYVSLRFQIITSYFPRYIIYPGCYHPFFLVFGFYSASPAAIWRIFVVALHILVAHHFFLFLVYISLCYQSMLSFIRLRSLTFNFELQTSLRLTLSFSW